MVLVKMNCIHSLSELRDENITSQNTSQNSISVLREKKIFGFPCCSSRKDLFIQCINYHCRTDIDKARVISYLESISAQVKIQF